MAANNPLGAKVCQQFSLVSSERKIWDQNYQDIKQLVRPDGGNFNRVTTQGQRRYDDVYDGTAISANIEFASGLHSYLTSPTDRWFELGCPSIKNLQDYPEALQWLEDTAELIYGVYSDPRSNFNPALHEVYLDLGAFGTGVLLQEYSVEKNHISFRNDALSEFYFQENAEGCVDTLFQYFEYTAKQIADEYERDGLLGGTELWKQVTMPANALKKFKLIRMIYPRKDRIFGKLDKANKAFGSITVAEATMDVLRIDGYDSFPHAVTRWLKVGGETYGRGPASTCMPDIMSLQTMERTLLKAGQKAVDPPLVIPNDGFMDPISIAPGSIIYKEPGAEKIESLDFRGNLNFGMEQTNQKREYINKCFHTDWFKRFRKNREQSATEVLDDRDEMLRFLAPMLGRQQTELLGPVIKRTFQLLMTWGQIPKAPPILNKGRLEIVYISPAARAQQGVKADRMSRFMQDITPLAQIDASIMDGIIPDKMVQLYANTRGVTRSILRSTKDIEQIRAERAQQKQLEQASTVAEPASQSVLNLAKAAQATGGGSSGGPI